MGRALGAAGLVLSVALLLGVGSQGARESSDDGGVAAVVVYHRHGDRGAIDLMPNDQVNNMMWPDPPGSLTTRGMRQLELLGGAFRERYLLGRPYRVARANYSRGEVWSRSTDYDRTIESAASFLRGLFPGGSSAPGGLSDGSPVVPVRTLPRESDVVLLGFKGLACPRILELRAEALASAEWQRVERGSERLRAQLALISGYEPDTLTAANISVVADTLFCERQHGMRWLPGFNDSLFEQANELLDRGLRPQYVYTPEMRRLAAGPMLAELLARLRQASEGREGREGPAPPRIVHYSAHDTTLVTLLGALGVFDDVNPSYASSVVFELLKGPPAVRVFYNRGPEAPFSAAALVPLCGAPTCSLEQFERLLLIPEDYEAECAFFSPAKRISKRASEDELSLVGAAALAGTTLLMVLLCACGTLGGGRSLYGKLESSNPQQQQQQQSPMQPRHQQQQRRH